MQAGTEILVSMYMDWKPKSSRDYSLVLWSTEQPVSIEPNDSGTRSSSFPFTQPRSTDLNAAEENGSDQCFVDPQILAFKQWYESFDPFDVTACSGTFKQKDIEGLFSYYALLGGCASFDSINLKIGKSQEFWNRVVLNEGAVLISTSEPDSNGIVNKMFNLKAGPGNMDRIALLVLHDETIDSASALSSAEVTSGVTACQMPSCGTRA